MCLSLFFPIVSPGKYLIVNSSRNSLTRDRYWWILSVITYLPAAYPNYTPQIQGLLFLGLILGTMTSEALCSGTLGDTIMLKFAKANGGVRLAECRLWLIYPAVAISAGMSMDTT